jgi:myo-inositol 2-dehydrogenase/D-chiro-inositol 1-dehydrogenase
MLEFALFGAGRIGAIHADNIARHPEARLKYVVDVSRDAAERIGQKTHAEVLGDPSKALADPAVKAVLIASPTNTHVDLIIASARAKKAIFCEKPIDLDLARVDVALAEIQKAGVPFFIGFNRRFDPSFAKLREESRSGAIGKIEMVTITSRDPGPPPMDYVKVSGGIFRDMTIHDFDMARWLLPEEPVEVFASASCLVDPKIAAAGDLDSAMIVLTTAGGVLCHIQNSRRAAYGYDQRIEVLGEKGMLQAGNKTDTTISRWTKDGVSGDKPLHFFLERYADAYKHEMAHFIDAVSRNAPLGTGPKDGKQALALAEAALESLRAKKAVRVSI